MLAGLLCTDKYDVSKDHIICFNVFKRVLHHLKTDSVSRNFALLASAFLIAAWIQIIWVCLTMNLALLIISCNMLFKTFTLVTYFCIQFPIWCKIAPSYSHSYHRQAMVINFSSAICLVIVSFFIVVGEIELFFYSSRAQIDHRDGATILVLFNLFLHVIVCIYYPEYIYTSEEYTTQYASPSTNSSRISLSLLRFCALPSVFILTAEINMLFTHNQWASVDLFLVLFLAGINVSITLPQCYQIGILLLQGVPNATRASFDELVSKALSFDDVIEIPKDRLYFWVLSPGISVATFIVHVRADTDERKLLSLLLGIFGPMVKYLTIQIEKGLLDSKKYLDKKSDAPQCG